MTKIRILKDLAQLFSGKLEEKYFALNLAKLKTQGMLMTREISDK